LTLEIRNSQPKVAVFYDWLNQWGGAERVLQDILQIYPQADLYTLVYDPVKTKWLPKNIKIFSSGIGKLPLAKTRLNFYTPVFDIFLEQFDFHQYDIVISTTSVVGHCLLTQPSTLFVCYTHNINRHLYFNSSHNPILKYLLKKYRLIDNILSQRPDYYLTNSKTVSQRILEKYNRNSIIINPGVDTDFFVPSTNPKSDYFLTVGRLVPHKKIDLAIDACHQLGHKLIIIGDGRHRPILQQQIDRLNDPNIKIIGSVSQTRLLDYYQNCQALICPQEEDFGISPLEAMACGKPVIGFGKGGISETVIHQKTGLLFKFQTVASLVSTLKKFSKQKFNPVDCRTQAVKYSRQKFMLNFRQQIDTLWQQHQNHTTLS